MHAPHGRPARPLVAGSLLLLALAAALAACDLLPFMTASAPAAMPLVSLEVHGGLCPDGECRFTADIYRDGRVVRSDGEPQVVDTPSLALLVQQVERADWEAIMARPFGGECPTAYDGQEQVYTFSVGDRPIVVASCEVVVEHDREPFQLVQAILIGLGG